MPLEDVGLDLDDFDLICHIAFDYSFNKKGKG
jgi:hypothetical protein